MTSPSRVRRTLVIAATVPIVLSAVAACSGSGAAGDATPSPGTSAVATSVATASPLAKASPAAAATPSEAASPLTVISSLADGPLTRAVDWTARVSGPTDVAIDRVEFLLDGKVAWTEHNPPYTFNDDGNVLMPWVLTPGSHQLAINVVTASGVAATTQIAVTTDRAPVPAALLDRKFVRNVPANASGPAGDWHLRFGADGVIIVTDPWGGGVTEGFQAGADGTFSLYGPANWAASASLRGSLCDYAEGAVAMHWEVKGSELALSSDGQPDPCPDRASVFAGTWTVSP